MDPPLQASDEFRELCSELHAPLVGMLTLYCGDRELAHDLAQETLARMWSDRRKLARIDAPRGYAYRIALNLAKNEFRRNAVRRRYRTRIEADHLDVHHDPDAAQALALRDAVAALPPRKRSALVLRYFADLSVEETARAMGAPPNTVKTLTRRAIADLRTSLHEQAAAEPPDDQENHHGN